MPSAEQSHNYDKLTFSSDGKVEAVFNGPLLKGSHKLANKQVQITLNNSITTWIFVGAVA